MSVLVDVQAINLVVSASRLRRCRQLFVELGTVAKLARRQRRSAESIRNQAPAVRDEDIWNSFAAFLEEVGGMVQAALAAPPE